MWNFILHFCFCLIVSTHSFKFTAVSPKTIRAYSTHRVVVSLVPNKTEEQVEFSAILSSASITYTSPPTTVSTGVSSILRIKVDELPDTLYNLTITAKGEKGQVFNETQSISVDKKTAIIFIQTSKQIYSPKETLKFRVLVLDRFLKPFPAPKTIDIFVYDSRKNIVKTQLSAPLNQFGYISSEVEIPHEPAMGQWNIHATYLTQVTETKSVTVENYQIPKFEVYMKTTPKFVTHNDSKVVVHVKSDTIVGDRVKGTLTVTLGYSKPHLKKTGSGANNTVEKTVPIHGMASVTFNIAEELGVQESDVRDSIDFKFVAKVTGAVTGNRRFATKEITMHRYPYKIMAVRQQPNYKPGFPLTLTLKVSTQDDNPIIDTNPEALEVRHGFSYYAKDGVIKTRIPPSGLVKLKFWTPSNVFMSIEHIEVRYKELVEKIYLPKRIESPTETYLNLELTHRRVLEAPSNVSIHVSSNREFNYVNYIVLARGKAISAGRFDFDKADQNHTVPIYMGDKVTPKTTLIVYTIIEPYSEVIVDRMQLKFHVNKAPLKLAFSKNRAEPKSNVSIEIDGPPNAMVALRAIDQSVFMSKEDEDITNSVLKQKVAEFEEGDSSFGDNWFTAFQDVGLILHTNCKPEGSKRKKSSVVWTGANGTESSKSDSEDDEVRKYFPQAWIWEEVINGPDGKSIITKDVPEIMTSWILSGYSIDPQNGLVVSRKSSKLKVFRPFFLTYNVPTSVKIGEVSAIEVLVLNNLPEDVTTKVTLFNDNFHFLLLELGKAKNSTKIEKEIVAKTHEITSVVFILEPQKIGEFLIKVTANAGLAGDTLEKSLLVKPTGMKVTGSTARLIDLKETNLVRTNLTALIPKKRVLGADKIHLQLKGNILGTAVYAVPNLIQMPGGDGMQNLISLTTNAILDAYMSKKNIYSEETLAKAKMFIIQGLETQFSFLRKDGSFSQYGNGNRYGSTTATALSLRVFTFLKPKKYLAVDENVIETGLKFLQEQQKADGFFVEQGTGFSSSASGHEKNLIVTAYCLLAFAEVATGYFSTGQFNQTISNGQAALIRGGKKSTSAFVINLITYYLHHVNHPAKDEYYEISQSMMQHKTEYEGYMEFWSDDEHYIENNMHIDAAHRFKSNALEATSYGLQIYLFRDEMEESLPVLTWILHQRTSHEMFMTPMGRLASLAALAKYDLATWGNQVNLDVKATWSQGEELMHVGIENILSVQEVEIDSCSRTVALEANGTGTVMAQLQWSYNTENPLNDGISQYVSAFVLTVDVDSSAVKNELSLEICVAYADKEYMLFNSMAAMEVHLPSGFMFNPYKMKDVLSNVNFVKKHELKEVDTQLHLYIEGLTTDKSCFTVSGQRTQMVAHLVNSLVNVHDFHDIGKSMTVFYKAPVISVCDICYATESCKMSCW